MNLEVKDEHWINYFLRFFDNFGVGFNFRIKDQDTYKSRLGGGLFLIYLTFSIFYFFVTFRDFYMRKNYVINSYNLLTQAPRIQLNNSGLYIAFALYYDNNTFLEKNVKDYLKHRVYLTTIRNSSHPTKTRTKLNTSHCSRSYFMNTIDENTFKSLQLENFKCSHFNETSFVQGSYSENFFQYIEIETVFNKKYFNNNSTINNSTNLSEISEFFKKNVVKFSLYWTATSLDVRDYYDPLSSFLSYYVTYVDYERIRKINMHFSQLNFFSDSDYLFRNPQKYSNITFQDVQEYSLGVKDRELLGELGNQFIKLYLSSSSSTLIVERRYLKLTEFFANFGGLQSNILLVLSIVVNFFNKFRAQQMLMNKIFKFREHIQYRNPDQFNFLKEEFKILKNLDSNSNFCEMRKNNFYGISEEKVEKAEETFTSIELSSNKKDSLTPLDINLETQQRVVNINSRHRKPFRLPQEEIITLALSKKPLNFSSIEIIRRAFPCKGRELSLKNKLFIKAFKKMEYYFDVFTYLKKVQEIDIIKFLILDEDQTKLFKFLSKPSVSLAYSDSDDLYQNMQKNRLIKSKIRIEEIEEVVQCYKALSNSKHDSLNNKLLTLFDYEVEHLVNG